MSSSHKNLIKIKSASNDASSSSKKVSDHSTEKAALKSTVSSINQTNLVHIQLSDDCKLFNAKHGKSPEKNRPQVVDKVKIKSIIQQPCFEAIWNDKDNILKTVSQTKTKSVKETNIGRSSNGKALHNRFTADKRRHSPTYCRKSYSRSKDHTSTHRYTDDKGYDKSRHHKHLRSRSRTWRSYSHKMRRCSSPIYRKRTYEKIKKQTGESIKNQTEKIKETKSDSLHDRKRQRTPIRKEEQSSSKLLSNSADNFTSQSIEDEFQENKLSLESPSNVNPIKSNSDDKHIPPNITELGSPFVKKLAETVRTMLMNKTSLSEESNSPTLSAVETNSKKPEHKDTKFCIKFDIDWPEIDENTAANDMQPSSPSSSASLYSACEDDESENELDDEEVVVQFPQMPNYSGEPGSVIHNSIQKMLLHAETEPHAVDGKNKSNDNAPTKEENVPHCSLGSWFSPNLLDLPSEQPAEELRAPVCMTCSFANSHLEGVVDPRLQSRTYVAVLRLGPRCCICFKCLKDEKYGMSHIPPKELEPKIVVGLHAAGVGENEQPPSDAESSTFRSQFTDNSAIPPAKTPDKYNSKKVCTVNSCVYDVTAILPESNLNSKLPVKKRKTIFASNLDLNKADASTVVPRTTAILIQHSKNVLPNNDLTPLQNHCVKQKKKGQDKVEDPVSSNDSILKHKVSDQTAIATQNPELVKDPIGNITTKNEASVTANTNILLMKVSKSQPSVANIHLPDSILPSIEKATNETSSDDSLRHKDRSKRQKTWSSTSLDDSDVSSDLIDTSSSCVHSTPTRTETIIVESSSDLAPEPIGLFDLFQLKPGSENKSPNGGVHFDQMPETCGSTIETSDDQTTSLFDHLRETFDLPLEPQPPILLHNSDARISTEDDLNESLESSDAGPRIACKRRPAPLLYSDLSDDDNEGPVCAKESSQPAAGPPTIISESLPLRPCTEICANKPSEIAVSSPNRHSSFDFSSPRKLQIVEESDCDQQPLQDKSSVSITLEQKACAKLSAKIPPKHTGESLKNKALVNRNALLDLESDSSSSAVKTPIGVTASVEQNVSDNSSQDWSNPDWLEDQLPSLSRNRRKRKSAVAPLLLKTVLGVVENSQPKAQVKCPDNSDPSTPSAETQNKEIPFKKRKFSNAVLTESSTDETSQAIGERKYIGTITCMNSFIEDQTSNFHRISQENTACSEECPHAEDKKQNNSREINCHDMEVDSVNFKLSGNNKDTLSSVEEITVNEKGVNEEDYEQPLSCDGDQSKGLLRDSELSETANSDDEEFVSPCFYSKGKAYPWPYVYPTAADMEAMSDSDEDTSEPDAFDKPFVFLKRMEEDGFVPKCFVETLPNHECCACCPMHCCATSWISIESLTV